MLLFCGLWLSCLTVQLKASDTSLVTPKEIKANSAQADDINLALRRTADKLLRAMGDSTSRIPAVEQVSDHAWRVYLNQPFDYNLLPSILQSSLDQYEIRQSYEVTVRECETSTIDLGYHQKDFLVDSIIPCGTRVFPKGCHYIEVAFSGQAGGKSYWAGNRKILFGLFGFIGLAGFAFWRMKRKPSKAAEVINGNGASWISFGQSSIHVTNPTLECGGVRHQLTFREAKLLRFFASHPGELLERDQILEKVWEDEGVQVTRSVDVFVSRLRKKLAGDPTIGIVAVHGVGYKLDTEMAAT
jgi:DNA-binding winged helix-turn-helix (wHTH) protein